MVAVMKQHEERVRVVIAGADYGVWDEHDAPNVSFGTSRYRPGGSKNAVAVAGLPDRGEGSVSKVIRRNEVNFPRGIERAAQDGARIRVTAQPLGPDMNPFGDARIYTGIVSGVEVTDYDSDGDDLRMMTVTYQADDQAT